MNFTKGIGFLLAMAVALVLGASALANTPRITLGAGHTGVTIMADLSVRTQTALQVIQAHIAQTQTQLSSPTDVKIQWADGFAEVYRYLGPPNEEMAIWKELIYPQSMVGGGTGWYRYNGTGWVRVSYECPGCFYYGEVGDVKPAPETSEP